MSDINPPPSHRPLAPVDSARLEEQGRLLDRILGRQLGRLRTRFAIHGLGYVAAALALALTVYFLLDRTLGLPGPVRIILTLAVVLLCAVVARRRLIYPLARQFSRTDMALALERAFPQLRQSLVSAFQLKEMLTRPEGLRNQSPEMISGLVAETAQNVRDLPVDRVLDTRRTLRVWGVAGLCIVVVGVGIAVQPLAAGIFAQRMFGADVSYPRATDLHIVLPQSSDAVRVEVDGRTAVVTLASQTDLHVTVRAEGEIPRDVYLRVTDFRGQNDIATSPRAEGRFRHVFRRVQGEFSFYAFGGDDDRGNLEVQVQTIDPPLVGRISATVTPPAYTGGRPSVVQGGGVEALRGSTVEIEIAATAAVERGELVFEESDLRVALTRGLPDSGDGDPVWRGAFDVQGDDRYRVDLVGDTGLTNPQSGTYAVIALADFAPIGRLLTPDSNALAVLPTAVVPVRAEFRDDWAVTSAQLHVHTARAEPGAPRPLLPEDYTATDRVQVTHLFAVRDLLGLSDGAGDLAAASQGNLGLGIEVADNRAPEPQLTELPIQQLLIVDQTQLSSQIQRLFRSVRENVEEALSVQEDRLERLEDLIANFSGTATRQHQGMLSAVEVGQARVRSLAEQVHLRLMEAFDLHLFNGLEGDNATAQVLDFYLEFHRTNPEPVAYVPEFYRTLAQARQGGQMGAMPRVLDPILGMVGTARVLATERTVECARMLTQAQVAQDPADITEYCQIALDLQKRIQLDLKSLLERLGEWNDIQDVIQETRALRDKQREIQNRTQEVQGR